MSDFWNERYKTEEYVYGDKPNEFLAAHLKGARGDWLFPADGEGRNGVYAATLGLKVFSVDQSSEGKNKALKLAAKKGVEITYTVGLIEDVDLGSARFDGAALIFAHFPADIRSSAHAKILRAIKPGGTIIFEAFSKKQLEYQKRGETSGGPQDSQMLFSIEEIRQEFPGVEFSLLEEREVYLAEGAKHSGHGHVVHFVGKKL